MNLKLGLKMKPLFEIKDIRRFFWKLETFFLEKLAGGGIYGRKIEEVVMGTSNTMEYLYRFKYGNMEIRRFASEYRIKFQGWEDEKLVFEIYRYFNPNTMEVSYKKTEVV